MPAAVAIPAIASLGGAAISALGGRGPQQSQQQSNNSVTNANQSSQSANQQTGSNNFWNTSTPNEPDYFSQFRQGLIPQFQNAVFNASKPVFGQGQMAQYLSNLNGEASGAGNRLKQMLAKTGGLNSGRYATGLSNIESGRLGAIGKFNQQLPFMEQQGKNERLNSLLGIGTNFAGRAPVGTSNAGDAFSQMFNSGSANQSGTSNTNGTGNASQSGQPFGSGLLQNLGGLLNYGGNGYGGLGGLVNMFGNNNTGSTPNIYNLPQRSNYNPSLSGWPY